MTIRCKNRYVLVCFVRVWVSGIAVAILSVSVVGRYNPSAGEPAGVER